MQNNLMSSPADSAEFLMIPMTFRWFYSQLLMHQIRDDETKKRVRSERASMTCSHDGLYPMILFSRLSLFAGPGPSHWVRLLVTGILFLLIKTLLGARNRFVLTDVVFLKYRFGFKEDHDKARKWTKLTDLKS